MTVPEQRLWWILRKRQLDGYRFRRQHPIGDYIVDFCCPTVGLVIEVDGDPHADRIEYDDRRTRWLEQQGYRVLRVGNHDVMTNLSGVYGLIEEWLRAPPPPDLPRSRRRSRGRNP